MHSILTGGTIHTMHHPILPCVELATGDAPVASIIWLHGLGADGHDFEPIVPALGLPGSLHVRFVFPHAPSMPVTVNGGYIMPAWYDIRHADISHEQDKEGIHSSAISIEHLIEREIMHGIPAKHIVLAGFSQGGAMALHVGLRQNESLAGIIALSCYLPLAEKMDAGANPACRNTSIFMAHGVEDPIVPFALGDQSRRQLTKLGYPVQWHSYPIGHHVYTEEIKAVGQWLSKRLRHS